MNYTWISHQSLDRRSLKNTPVHAELTLKYPDNILILATLSTLRAGHESWRCIDIDYDSCSVEEKSQYI